MDTKFLISLITPTVFLLLSFSFLTILGTRLPKITFEKLKYLKKEDAYKKLEKTFKRFSSKKRTVYQEAKAIQKKKNPGKLSKFFQDLRTAMMLEKRAYALGRLLMSLVFAFALGVIISIVFLKNLVMLPALVILLMAVPIIFKVFKYYTKKLEVNSALESALSLVTTSYLQTNSVILSVKENINYINEPIRSIFMAFLHDSTFVFEDTKYALSRMKTKLDSTVFQEWVDTMIACVDDKDLKTTLIPVVHKLSDMRLIARELDTIIYSPLKEFVLVVVFYFLSIPLIFFLNKTWWNTIVYTSIGRIYIAVSIVVIIICMIGVISLTRPIEYKR